MHSEAPLELLKFAGREGGGIGFGSARKIGLRSRATLIQV